MVKKQAAIKYLEGIVSCKVLLKQAVTYKSCLKALSKFVHNVRTLLRKALSFSHNAPSELIRFPMEPLLP